MRAAILSALLLLASIEAEAQCVTQMRTATDSPDTIILNPVGFPSADAGVVAAAAQAWNSSSCNAGGSAFPKFALGSGPDAITVQYVDGVALDPQEGGQWLPASNTILIYSKAKLGMGTYPSGNPTIVTQTVEHELGHVLGLGNNSCSADGGFIMAPLVGRIDPNNLPTYNNRSVNSQECTEAALLNNTATERQKPSNPPPQPPPPPPNPPGPDTPIIIDLAGNGFNLSGPQDPVTFDLDADGVPETITWTSAGEDDAFLCLDRNGNGVIDDGAELFGNATPLRDGTTAPNGYIALAELDRPDAGGNGNGVIDPGDAAFGSLRLWVDSNHDGISEPWELVTLQQAGVARIGLTYRETRRRDRYGNVFRYAGLAWVFGDDGRAHAVLTSDVFLVQVH